MKTSTRLKLIVLTVALLLLGAFISLNTESVEVNLIFRTVSMSRSLMLISVLTAGFVLGWVTRSLRAVKTWAEDRAS